MNEVWNIVVIAYWIIFGVTLLTIILKITIPYYIFSIDEVTENKEQVFQSVLKVIEKDFSIRVNGLLINYDYTKNDELQGCYDPSNHCITLFMDNLETVNSYILTLTEEIHHSIFISTKSGIKIYELYDKKVGYENNPLEYAAKVYALNNFKSIHRVLKKRGLIRYKV